MNDVQVGGMRLLLDLSQPLYEQVLDQVRSSIAKGEIALGDKIPSVREMAQALKINPNTVMRAYQELERDGLTQTRRGQGTFITTDADKVQEVRNGLAERAVDEFLGRMASLGFTLKDIERLIGRKGGDLK
ncbi:GntR family transcriptional regulator [Paenibacillus beijingensis]|uniref:GntR family transcriptional regulator n=1 Tax=Paenibacillus beijingensis TaxID=1126833 RepID=A0A0D5NGI6_9BACL|nr:GntR family transcriptional regulator [Paenibacillus beijingensis]AJY74082.1 GntR family transcriptional regulator [Paenibacillus beijingensis]